MTLSESVEDFSRDMDISAEALESFDEDKEGEWSSELLNGNFVLMYRWDDFSMERAVYLAPRDTRVQVGSAAFKNYPTGTTGTVAKIDYCVAPGRVGSCLELSYGVAESYTEEDLTKDYV